MQMRFVAIQTLLNFGVMKDNSGHPNRNICYYDREGNDYDIGEVGEPILGELSYPNTIQYNSLLTLPWWGFSVTMRLKKKELIKIREVVNNSIKRKECGEQSNINIPI